MNSNRIIGISFIAVGILAWLFGPFLEQFKDFTTVLVLVIGLIIIGIFLIVKSFRMKIKK